MKSLREFFGKIAFPSVSDVAKKAGESIPPFVGSVFNRRLLFVEDEGELRLVMREIIKRFACEMDEAPDGATALLLFEPKKYDLILLDLRLPDISGVEVLRKIREKDVQQNVAVFSGYLDSHTIDEVYEAGWAFLGRKPDDMRDGEVLRMMLRTAGIVTKPEYI